MNIRFKTNVHFFKDCRKSDKETTLTSMVNRLKEQEAELERHSYNHVQLMTLESILEQQGHEIQRLTAELATVTRFADAADHRTGGWRQGHFGVNGVSSDFRAHPQTSDSHAISEQYLQRISGINAKRQALLYAKGITTFAQLATRDEAQLSDVLEQATRHISLSAHELHQIWVEQARLIMTGNQQGLRLGQQQFRQRTQRDNLQQIWGMGPKTATTLRIHGIETFEQLAALATDQLEAMVQTSHAPYDLDGQTLYTIWSELAQLAASSAWDEFEAKERQLHMQYGVLRDDLQQIRGIGPELDRVLRHQGVHRFADLAQIEITHLDTILKSAGLSSHLLGPQLHPSWTKQAQLAADGEWEALEALQLELGWWNNLETFAM